MSEIPTPSLGLYLFNIIIFLSLLMGYSRCYNGKNIILKSSLSNNRIILFGVLLYTLSVFGFSDLDFYGYYEIFKRYTLLHRETHMEQIYFKIANITTNYYLWRAIVWGVATILLLSTIKRLSLNTLTTLVFIGLFYAIHFFKLRNVLGFSIGFYGLSILLNPNLKCKHIQYIVGILLIFSSYYFHRSMIITIALMAVCFIRLSRLFVISSFIAWPFLLTATTLLLKYVVSNAFDMGSQEMEFGQSARHYAESEEIAMTLFGQIRFVFDRVALYVPLIYCSIIIYFNKRNVPCIIRAFMNFWYASFYVASLFMFQNTSNWIGERIWTMGLFPMCVVMGYMYSYPKRTRMMKLCMILPLISLCFALCYKIYKL